MMIIRLRPNKYSFCYNHPNNIFIKAFYCIDHTVDRNHIEDWFKETPILLIHELHSALDDEVRSYEG